MVVHRVALFLFKIAQIINSSWSMCDHGSPAEILDMQQIYLFSNTVHCMNFILKSAMWIQSLIFTILNIGSALSGYAINLENIGHFVH